MKVNLILENKGKIYKGVDFHMRKFNRRKFIHKSIINKTVESKKKDRI
jgi:hypothetical protein